MVTPAALARSSFPVRSPALAGALTIRLLSFSIELRRHVSWSILLSTSRETHSLLSRVAKSDNHHSLPIKKIHRILERAMCEKSNSS
jgi:hypothetical protein